MKNRLLISVRHWGDHAPRYRTTDALPQRAAGADVDTIVKAFVDAVGQLHPSDVVKIRALMAKVAGADVGHVNRMGVTSVGQEQPKPSGTVDHIADRGQRDMRRIRAETTSEVDRINAANRAFWDGGGKPAA
jgi:hypothetical protein